MKTTIEIPDEIFRKAKIVAASRNQTLRSLFTEALEFRLRQSAPPSRRSNPDEPPWMAGFGRLADLSAENRRILAVIEEEFETIDPEPSG